MSRNKYLLVLLMLGLLVAVLLWQAQQPQVQPDTIPEGFSDGFVMLANQQVNFELADNAAEQAVGLSNKSSIGPNQGMLFAFTEPNIPSFWMKNMQFPIDIIWINGNQVVGINPNLQPQPNTLAGELPTYSPPQPVNFVLEVQAGWAEQNGVQIGHNVEVVRIVQ
jgi:uncharacterized membrane protein (UPF0127 family)